MKHNIFFFLNNFIYLNDFIIILRHFKKVNNFIDMVLTCMHRWSLSGTGTGVRPY